MLMKKCPIKLWIWILVDDVWSDSAHGVSDLPVKHKKVIQTQNGTEKIVLFLNRDTQSTDDLKIRNTSGYNFVTGNEMLLNTSRSVYRNPNHLPDIYFIKKPIFSSCYRNQKRIESTIQPFRLSFFRPTTDYSNNRADKWYHTSEDGPGIRMSLLLL